MYPKRNFFTGSKYIFLTNVDNVKKIKVESYIQLYVECEDVDSIFQK